MLATTMAGRDDGRQTIETAMGAVCRSRSLIKRFSEYSLASLRGALMSSLALIAMALPWMSGAALANEPGVQDMIEALRPRPAEGLRTRSLAGAAKVEGGKLELSVQFEFDSAKVSPVSTDLLRKLALAMKSPALKGSRFLVEGHTDGVGAAAYNLELSARRAQSVREVLVADGVEATLLRTEGKGSTQLAEPDNPKSAANRRVRIVSLPPESGVAGAAPTAQATGTAPASTASNNANTNAANSNTTKPAIDEPREAGRVLRVQGEALLGRNRDGSDRDIPLTVSAVVMEGDRIQTAPDSTVLVALNDGARLVVRPGTAVSISESGLSAKLRALSQKIDLIVGAIRFITGDIGKRNPSGVQLKTPMLTIGIRGTDVELAHQMRTRSGAPAGSYVRVNTGAVALAGADGSELDLATGEQGYGAAQSVRMRGGATQPATRKQEAPAGLFPSAAEDAALLDIK